MDKVLIRKGKPSAVFEKDDVHYFYWPVELGFGMIKKWKLKIPTFPLKILDYEPIKVLGMDIDKKTLSRFHYRILTYFNKPKLIDGKPVIDFSFGSHSPFVHTDITPEFDFGSNIRIPENMDYLEIDALEALITLYWSIVKGKLKVEIEGTTTYAITSGNIPDEVIFKPTNMVAIIWFGLFPSETELEYIGYRTATASS